MERPRTTLFLMQSLDGKISTGIGERDVDKDYPNIKGLKEGLHQYYDLEKLTDMFSFNSGKVMAKIGVNNKKSPNKIPASFIILDNKPHLTDSGVSYLCDWINKLYLVTNNQQHPAYSSDKENLEIIPFSSFELLFENLYSKYDIEKITIQSGGTINAELLRRNIIDNVSIVVAPALIGGKDTSTLVDGVSLETESDILKISTLKLIDVKKLENSYIHLLYEVTAK